MLEDLPRKILYFTEVWLYPDGRIIHKRSWSKAQGFATAPKKPRPKPFVTVQAGEVEL